MEHIFYILPLIAVCICVSYAGEMTFELPDNEKQCFYEMIDKDVECTLEFQVITGGHYDVDMELTDPYGKSLYKDVKKQYDSYTWTTDSKGVYKFCFSNEFSTFTHKVVYFDLEVGDEDPLAKKEGGDAHATAMTMMETAGHTMYESLSDILDDQTHFKLREAQGRIFAEELNKRVMYWSIGESIAVLIIGIGQVLVLRSFFTEKKMSGMPNAH
ncbi:transmembrane emp24 domain-containing protein 7-like isoform X1 [Ruditapes philippinarum]|uniref:transmembrane emp24 domain-containing protein 7-like isoform X1 n=1 Tax=Ruditapes philippinarum TaxID=129788 RepID=UPI00295B34A5|nr:transmembrane emp24 domain-containing protein 7-like isoform X1 [Ruditapes philippinarum]